MFSLAISISALSFLNRVSAQQNCDETNFQPCLNEQLSYLSATCDPLRTGSPGIPANSTNYNACICYSAVSKGNCYLQCPNNSTVQNAFQGGITNEINALCGAANINPKALPRQFWQGAQNAVVVGGSATFNPNTGSNTAFNAAPSAQTGTNKNSAVAIFSSFGYTLLLGFLSTIV